MFVALLACKKESIEKESIKLNNGCYGGIFIYDTLVLYESFGISDDSFIEYASGGVLQQKYPNFCLTKGTYKIQDEMIFFNDIQIAQPPNVEISYCDEDYLLMGSYNIEEMKDSTISFSKNSILGKQEYKLKLQHSD